MHDRKSTFLAISHFVHHHLLWFLIGVYAVAAVYPTFGLWIRNTSFGAIAVSQEKTHVSLLMILLSLLMFNAGLGVQPSHLRTVMQKKLVLVAGLTANLVVPMVYIFGVTLVMQFWYEPIEAQNTLIGLALVAAMPIAGGSTAWAQNSNGNLALSLGLVLFSTVLSPIVTPVALQVFGEMAAEDYEAVLQGLAAYGSVSFLGLWVVLPSVLGLLIRLTVRDTWLTPALPHIKLINSVDLLLLNYSNASVSLPQVIADHDIDFLVVTVVITTGLCLIAFASGYGLSRLFKLNQAETVSLMYGLGMNNNGTGLVLASISLAACPRVMVPIIFYNFAQHLVAGSVHEFMGRSPTTYESKNAPTRGAN